MIGIWREAAIACLLLAGVSVGRADDLPPPDRPIEEVVDHYLDARLGAAGVAAVPEADDATLVRRTTLDWLGRVPTVAETRAYVEATDPYKRAQLVDRLMASPEFVRHQVNEFDALLMAGTRASLREYLTKALKEDRSWDRIFREILLADESDAGRKGASEFLKQRVKDLDKLTNDVSTTFFGVNVSCAKCHDHPRVRDWKQDHFYGMKSFFSRTFENGEFLAEREYGAVKFKTTEGKDKQAKFMFLTGRTLDAPEAKEPSNEEQKREKQRLDDYRKQKKAPPPPRFSARAQLAELALQPGEREFFARSIVNRLWNRFFGTGLVMPLDQMHSENPPSHPELLRWLARDTAEHGYDLRRLSRGLVLSRAYARSSQWESGELPKPQLFAVAAVRPLTPLQLATSMGVATTDPAAFGRDQKPEEVARRLEGLGDRARGLADVFAKPGEDYQISVSEALLLSNSDRLNDYLSAGGDRLVARMLRLKGKGEWIDLAVKTTLLRPPVDDEIRLLGRFLDGYKGRPEEACRQLVWALITSAEFRFNY